MKDTFSFAELWNKEQRRVFDIRQSFEHGTLASLFLAPQVSYLKRILDQINSK